MTTKTLRTKYIEIADSAKLFNVNRAEFNARVVKALTSSNKAKTPVNYIVVARDVVNDLIREELHMTLVRDEVNS